MSFGAKSFGPSELNEADRFWVRNINQWKWSWVKTLKHWLRGAAAGDGIAPQSSVLYFQSMALYSWYCWMYAINVIIYVVSFEFRKVYKMFFEDVFAGFKTLWRTNCFMRKSETSTPAIELMIQWAEKIRRQFLAWRCKFVQILNSSSSSSNQMQI